MKIYIITKTTSESSSLVSSGVELVTLNKEKAIEKLEELKRKHYEENSAAIDEYINGNSDATYENLDTYYQWCDEDGENEVIISLEDEEVDLRSIIEIEGGIIQNIYSNNQDHKILVIDRDTEYADDDEFIDKEYLNNFIGNEALKEVSYDSGVYDEDIDMNNK